MINVNELRIGNLISCYEESRPVDVWPMRVDGFSMMMPEIGDKWGHKVFVDNMQTDQSGVAYFEEPKELKPIPITEDWLVKFGFEVNPDNPKEKEEYEGAYKVNILGLQFENHGKYSEDGLVCWELNDGLKIKHVHELQNLVFAVTGKELELTV